MKFSLSGETDGGLRLSAQQSIWTKFLGGIDADSKLTSICLDLNGGFGNLTIGRHRRRLSTGALTEVGMLTCFRQTTTHHTLVTMVTAVLTVLVKLDGSDQILRYDNTFGDFGVALSYEMNDGSYSNYWRRNGSLVFVTAHGL